MSSVYKQEPQSMPLRQQYFGIGSAVTYSCFCPLVFLDADIVPEEAMLMVKIVMSFTDIVVVVVLGVTVVVIREVKINSAVLGISLSLMLKKWRMKTLMVVIVMSLYVNIVLPWWW